MATGTPDIDDYMLGTEFANDIVIHFGRLPGKWKNIKKIGQGGEGSVYLQEELMTTKLRAVKRLEVLDLEGYPQIAQRGAGSHTLSKIKREISNLIAINDHQDLFVELLGWYSNEDFVYLAMEYFELGDLAKYLSESGPRGEMEAKEITKQLGEGLMVLHERGICHRDLKPQNVLIASHDPIRIRLTDFGISKSTKGTALRTFVGTQCYIAPELQGFRPRDYLPRNEYTNAVDMWALGCLIHEILTTRLPFTTYSIDSAQAEINWTLFRDCYMKRTPFPVDNLKKLQVSSEGIDFVTSLLEIDPRARMSAIKTLGHEWLSSV